MNLKIQEGHSIEDFIKQIEMLKMKLGDVDEIISDKDLIHVVLCALPPSYSSFVMTVGTLIAKDPDIGFDDLEEWLSAEEARLNPSTHPITEESLSVINKSKFNSTSAKRGKSQSRSTRASTSPRKPLTCDHCGKQGHSSEKCWFRETGSQLKQLTVPQLQEIQQKIKEFGLHKQQSNLLEDTNDSPSSEDEHTAEEVNLVAMLSHMSTADSNNWILDSGASSHYAKSRKSFSKFLPKASKSSVTAAGGAKLPVTGKGCINFSGNKLVNHVLYVPSITRNLLSVGKFTDQGHNVVFTSRHCYVMDTSDPGKIFLKGSRDPSNLLYKLDSMDDLDGRFNPPLYECHKAETVIAHCNDSDVINLWHKRIGHINYKRLHQMTTKELVNGVPKLAQLHSVCESCIMGKMPKQRRPKSSTHQATRPLQLIHTDVCGPMPVASHFQSKYMLTFTDDFSRYTWVFFIKKKSQVFSTFQAFKLQVETAFQTKIATIRSDRGGEYLSTEFDNFLISHGIKRQLTVAGTPHQNGISERKNCTLFDCGRSMAFGSQLPNFVWEEVVRAANHILNRCITSSLKSSTPFQLLYNSKPDLSDFKVIECTAYVKLPKEKCNKLSAQAICYVLVGYDDQSKAYRVYHPSSRKIYISKDVLFDESTAGYQPEAEIPTFEDEFIEFDRQENTFVDDSEALHQDNLAHPTGVPAGTLDPIDAEVTLQPPEMDLPDPP
ncbi:unnamed protein product [Calypogeia fissa]